MIYDVTITFLNCNSFGQHSFAEHFYSLIFTTLLCLVLRGITTNELALDIVLFVKLGV